MEFIPIDVMRLIMKTVNDVPTLCNVLTSCKALLTLREHFKDMIDLYIQARYIISCPRQITQFNFFAVIDEIMEVESLYAQVVENRMKKKRIITQVYHGQ